MQMIIDHSNYNTIPYEVKAIIIECVEEKTLIEEPIIDFDIDVEIACEGIFREHAIPEVYKKIRNVLYKYDLRCFHATKLFNISEIGKNGLKINSKDRFLMCVRNTLRKLAVKEEKIESSIKLIEQEYNRKNMNGIVLPSICFFTNMIDFDKKDSAGYNQFCQNIGGEITRWALENNDKTVYSILKDNGKQVVVEFTVSFKDISFDLINEIIFKYICAVIAKTLWNYEYSISIDGQINKDVSPYNICEIKEFNMDLSDYEA